MNVRFELASLLVGRDVRRLLSEHERAVGLLSIIVRTDDVRESDRAFVDAEKFLDSLPVGAESNAVVAVKP